MTDGFLLDRTEVRQRITARYVIERVFADKGPEVEDRSFTGQEGVGRRNVERFDLGPLVCSSNGVAELIEDRRRVEGVGSLEPGACVLQVGMDGVRRIELIIDAIEDVLFVALIVKGLKLRSIEEAAGIQSADRDEVAPFGAAV